MTRGIHGTTGTNAPRALLPALWRRSHRKPDGRRSWRRSGVLLAFPPGWAATSVVAGGMAAVHSAVPAARADRSARGARDGDPKRPEIFGIGCVSALVGVCSAVVWPMGEVRV